MTLEQAQSPKTISIRVYIGGTIGWIAVLHTWSWTSAYHPHVHYLVSAGGLAGDHSKWIPASNKVFVPVKALSKIFRAMFPQALKYADPNLFQSIPKTAWHQD